MKKKGLPPKKKPIKSVKDFLVYADKFVQKFDEDDKQKPEDTK